MYRFWYRVLEGEPTGGNGGSGSGGNTPPPETPPSNEGNNGNNGGTPPASNEGSNTGTVSMTREEYEKEQRKIREAAERAVLNREDVKAALAAKTELDGIKQSQLTEAQRLEQERDNEKNARLKLEADFKAERLKNAFYLEASKAEKPIPAERLNDAMALADLSVVTFNDKGEAVGMDTAIKTLITAKPWIVAPVNGGTGVAPVMGGGSGSTENHTPDLLTNFVTSRYERKKS